VSVLPLALALLVLGIPADDAKSAAAADHLAVRADLLDGTPYLHGLLRTTP